MVNKNRIYLFDTTLRDGAQTQGVHFTHHDKVLIAQMLDNLAIDYIEGGFPGANPTDDQFFNQPPRLKNSQLVAFGMTRRSGVSADNDPSLRATYESSAPIACLVAKSWDRQIKDIMNLPLDENLAMIESSIKLLKKKKSEVMLDAEHFFDGFLSNPSYATEVLTTAFQAGASWVVLCDTRGGMIPCDIEKVINGVSKTHAPEKLGIHAHNDTDCAIANSLTAVMLGVRQVQGTLNGLGERAGNANILSLMADIHFKLGLDIGPAKKNLHLLTETSRQLDEILARAPNPHLPYVGANAFAHKGGLHGSAVMKDPASYEHINPESVGNERVLVMSDQSGKSNLRWHLKKFNLKVKDNDENLLLSALKDAEAKGFSFDGAEASLEIFVKKQLHQMPEFFHIKHFHVGHDSHLMENGEVMNDTTAKVEVEVNKKSVVKSANGNGPVNALDGALRQALLVHFPQLAGVELVDYKVRIIPPSEDYQSTAALTRVMIESSADNKLWTTVGVSSNIILASMLALGDAYRYYLLNGKSAR